MGFHHVGWFARDPTILRKVGHILLQLPYMDVRQPRRILIADDCFKLSLIPNEHTVGAVIRSVQKIIGRMFLPVLIYVDGWYMLLVPRVWSCVNEVLPFLARVTLDKVGITEAVYVSCMQLL